MAADPLSDLLKTVRLTGAAFFEIAADGVWSIGSPTADMILPKVLPDADHLIAYHVVTAGRCFGTLVGGQSIALEAGEVIVFMNADAHVMSSGPNMAAEPVTRDVVDVATAGEIPYCINYAGDGPVTTRLVCGYLACDAGPFNPLLENLPAVITAGDAPDGSGWLGQFIRLALAETAEKRAGSESVLTKLSELMFIDVVRRHIAMHPPGQAGWLAGLRDPFIAKVLALVHGKPAHDWTIEELAKQSGQSRTVLAERFADIVGMPPMQYLAKWRMQIASQRLSGSNDNVASIAAAIGYESEAAFSRAFKKIVGVPPSDWRRRARQTPL